MLPHPSALATRKRKACIIWDLDGTLIDSSSFCLSATNEVLIGRGFPAISMSDYLYGARYPTPRRMAFHATRDPDHPVGADLGREFDELYLTFVSHESVKRYVDTAGVVESFQIENVCQAVLSNACGAYVRKVCGVLKLDDTMQCALGADDVGAVKPAPDGLLYISRFVEIPPEFCIYVGDAETDGDAARSAGMHGVYCAWGAPEREEEISSHFNHTVRNRDELMIVLNNFVSFCMENNRGRRKSGSIVWDPEVVDNEHEHKLKTDNEYWDGRR